MMSDKTMKTRSMTAMNPQGCVRRVGEKVYKFDHLVDKPMSLLPQGAMPIIPQQRKIMDLLINKFGVGNLTCESAVVEHLRSVNVTHPFTKYPDPYRVFLYHLKPLEIREAVVVRTEDFESIRTEYVGNAVNVTHEGVCLFSGIVSEVYQYGDLTIFAIHGDDESWAAVYVGNGLVQHHYKVCRIERSQI